MERYPSYKPSGMKWLGEIPSHWEVCRFKNLMSLVTTPSNDSNKIGLENIESGSGKFIQTENEFEGNGVHFQVNDVVYGKLRPYLQKVWLATFSGNAVGDFFVFRMNNKVVGKYLQYLMLSRCFTDDVNASTYGAKMPRVSSEYILTMRCAVPSKDEQIKMVSYLDSATAKIDAAIAQQQKMIDLLNERKQIIINRAVTKGLNPNAKMKDSGVEWIGEVPEDWEIKKLKHLAKVYGRIGFRGYNASDLVDEGEWAITLSPSNMKEHKMQYEKCTYLSWDKYYESPEIMIKNGDVLFVKTGSTYGKSCLVENLPMEATINPQLVVFKEFNCSNSFFEYLLQSNIIRDQVELSVIGGTIPTISQEKILNYMVPIPNMDEQLLIVDSIKDSCRPINEAIINTNKQISLLQERKQIIINEVVTGKVKVTN